MRRLLVAAVAAAALFAFAGTAAAAQTPAGSFVGILCQHDNPTSDFTCGTRTVSANTPFWVGVTYYCGGASACVSAFRFTLTVTPDVSYKHFFENLGKQPDGTFALRSVYSFDQGLPAGTYSFHWELYEKGKLVYQGTTPIVAS